MGNQFSIFYLKMFTFILVVYIADFSVGNVLKYFYFKQNSGFQYRTTYAMQQTNADFLIFGSSRASHHYNPEIIENSLNLSCYNVGRDGSYIFYHTALLKVILNRYLPKIIILDLVKGEFRQERESYDRISNLLPYYDSYPEIHSIIELRNSYEKIKLCSKIYPYNSDILSIAIGNTEFNKGRWIDIKGFSPWYKTMDCPEKIDTSFFNTKIDNVKVSQYENFIKECKYKGILLYIVVSPYYLISDITDNSIKISKDLAGKYNIKHFDFSQDTTFKLKCSLFGDLTHLNIEGTRIFTQKVIEKIIKDNQLNMQYTKNKREGVISAISSLDGMH